MKRSFRFSLRTALICVALICVLLVAILAQSRRIADFEAWDNGLRNVICRNVSIVPKGTRPIQLTAWEPDLDVGGPADAFDGTPVEVLNDTGVVTLWAPGATLQIDEALKSESPSGIANRLLRHYESDFGRRGLRRISLSPAAVCPSVVEKSTVWISERPERNTFVTIDIRVDADAAQADVRFRHVGRPDLSRW